MTWFDRLRGKDEDRPRGAQLAATPDGWSVFRSQSGLYALSYPSDWAISSDGNITNLTPHDQAALTVSGFVGRMQPDAFHKGFLDSQPTADALTGAIAVSGRGWTGLRQSFVDRQAAEAVFLDALMACGESGFVLVTWNQAMDPSPPAADATYFRVFDSLVLSPLGES